MKGMKYMEDKRIYWDDMVDIMKEFKYSDIEYKEEGNTFLAKNFCGEIRKFKVVCVKEMNEIILVASCENIMNIDSEKEYVRTFGIKTIYKEMTFLILDYSWR